MPEGEVTCGICDSDFDGTSGMDKTGRGYGEYLIRYYEPEPEPQPVPEPQVQPVVVEKSQMDIMKEIYCNNKIL